MLITQNGGDERETLNALAHTISSKQINIFATVYVIVLHSPM